MFEKFVVALVTWYITRVYYNYNKAFDLVEHETECVKCENCKCQPKS